MQANNVNRWAALLATILCAQANAQMIPAEDFSRHSEVNEVALSPSGKHLAMAIPTADGSETQLQVVNLDGKGDVQGMRFARQQHVNNVIWTADEQLVVSRAKMEPLKARPYSLGELMTSDVKGKNQDVLFGYVPDNGTVRGRRKDEGFADLAMVLDNEPGMALVEFQCWNCGEDPDTVIFKVDTRTSTRQEIERADGVADFIFDRTGEARIRTTLDAQDEPVLHYRPSKGTEWKLLPEAIAGRTLNSGRFDTDNNTLYALVSDQGEPSKLYRIDLAAGTRSKLAGRDDVEVSYMMYAGRNGIPFAVVYDADKPSIQYLDNKSEWAQLHMDLLKRFPGQMLTVNDFSSDGRTVLFATWSDRNPGTYYLLDRDSNKIQEVSNFMPWLKSGQLAQTRPVTFTARDGSKLHGFYTAKGTGTRPLIVMPHGGPFGPYDKWGYDSDAQFLASRGYGVLQVNFRGSGGRGYNFQKSGWREWGGKIQDDIADGVRWAIDNQFADPARICTYGASFGGYSALLQPILHPDMYKCAIGYVGVYDLPLMRKTDEDSSKRTKRFFDRTLGIDDKLLAAVSPVQRVSELKVPVMLIHGKDDKTADFNQYKVMDAALRQVNRPAETLVVNGEGHGFYKPENRAELYRRMEAFLKQHIGTGTN